MAAQTEGKGEQAPGGTNFRLSGGLSLLDEPRQGPEFLPGDSVEAASSGLFNMP